jgi:hypothetical protein
MKTRSGKIDSIKMSDLQLRPEAAKVGLRNFGPMMWFYLSDGSQTKIDVAATMVVDFKTFERNIAPTSSYKWGYIVRDDSVLSADDFPAKPTEKPYNAIFDEEIQEMIKDEDKCVEYLSKVTSWLTIKRFQDACKDKRGLSNILSVCEDRMFIIENELPENFYELNKRQLVDLMHTKGVDIKVLPDDELDEVRDRVINLLSGA